jgi:WD40 repeat protein
MYERLLFCCSSIRVLRDHKCHKQSLTCLVLSSDGSLLFTGSKDAGLVMWDLKSGEKLARCRFYESSF